VGCRRFSWWPPGILGATWNIGGHPVIFLVGTWRFGDKLHFLGTQHLFCCARGLLVGTQCLFWWAPGISVGTQHFVCWACRIVVANCHLQRQPAFNLVATWHLLWWVAGVAFGGHLAFWGHLEYWWAPCDIFGGYMAFW